MQETPVQSLGWGDLLEKGRLPTPGFWPREFHGPYSPWGSKQSGTTEQLSLTQSLSYTSVVEPRLLLLVCQQEETFPA